MPIRGLAERARLPRLGKIRLGVKVKQNGKEYPKETDYFVVPDEIKPLVGDKPTKLLVLFPSDDLDRLFPTEYLRYQGKLCTIRCDGETCIAWPKDGGELTSPCRKDDAWKPCACGARAIGRLSVILWDGPMGIYQVEIKGDQRVADVLVELQIFKDTFKRLTDIVFELERVPTETQARKEDGTRMPKTGWPVHVRCSFSARQALQIGGRQPALALPAAAVEEEETDAAEEPEENGVTPPALLDGAHRARQLSECQPPRVDALVHQGQEAPPTGTPLVGDATIESCFKAAGALGVTPRAYELYLNVTYGSDVHNLKPEAVAEQAGQLAQAVRHPKAAGALKATILAAANKASKQGRLM